MANAVTLSDHVAQLSLLAAPAGEDAQFWAEALHRQCAQARDDLVHLLPALADAALHDAPLLAGQPTLRHLADPARAPADSVERARVRIEELERLHKRRPLREMVSVSSKTVHGIVRDRYNATSVA